MSSRKILTNILKVVVSCLAVYYVVSRIDIAEIMEKVRSADLLLLLAALAAYTISQLAASFRLRNLFNLVPITITQKENIKLYWLGLFYNLFLPGGVGGDGFKVYLLGKYKKSNLKTVIGAILSDRVSGLSIIVILLLVFIPMLDYNIPFKNLAWVAIPLVAAAFYLFLYIVNKKLLPAFPRVMGWAICVQMLQMLSAVLILASLHIDARHMYDAYLFLFFLSAIAGSLPITLGGIGARELVFLWGAQYLGVNEGSAIALSLMFYTASAITALPGIIYTIKPAAILKES